MNYFLAKTDPDTYSIDQLEKDRKTVWDGVHNNQAILVIRKMKVDDLVYVYHSQSDKSVVGMMKVVGEPYENKEDPRRSWAVEVEFIKKFERPLSLAAIKKDGRFSGFTLIRNSRLSTMEVPGDVVAFFEQNLA
jgi:predicted RNA-binding protein with PUA-like domain